MHLHIDFTASKPMSYRDILNFDAARREAASFPTRQIILALLALFLAVSAWALLG